MQRLAVAHEKCRLGRGCKPMGLLRRLADNSDPRSLAVRLRRRRVRFFEALLARVERPCTVLDVGGTTRFWDLIPSPAMRAGGLRVVLLNTTAAERSTPGLEVVRGDARTMREFRDREFDVVFSNSVIEHVGEFADQRRMAQEIQRVGVRYFVQTPNRTFPIEPHFLFPFYQHLPLAAQAFLLSRMRLGWHPREPDMARVRAVAASVRLRTEAELRALFPGASIYRERLLGLTKAFVAYHGF